MGEPIYQIRGITHFTVRLAVSLDALAAAYKVDSNPSDMRKIVDTVALQLTPEQMKLLQAKIAE